MRRLQCRRAIPSAHDHVRLDRQGSHGTQWARARVVLKRCLNLGQGNGIAVLYMFPSRSVNTQFGMFWPTLVILGLCSSESCHIRRKSRQFGPIPGQLWSTPGTCWLKLPNIGPKVTESVQRSNQCQFRPNPGSIRSMLKEFASFWVQIGRIRPPLSRSGPKFGRRCPTRSKSTRLGPTLGDVSRKWPDLGKLRSKLPSSSEVG